MHNFAALVLNSVESRLFIEIPPLGRVEPMGCTHSTIGKYGDTRTLILIAYLANTLQVRLINSPYSSGVVSIAENRVFLHSNSSFGI